jgi:hypothetical protein
MYHWNFKSESVICLKQEKKKLTGNLRFETHTAAVIGSNTPDLNDMENPVS